MAEHHEASEYRHGQMDITEHKKMFNAFVKFWIYQAIAIVGLLILLALLYV